MAPAKPRRIAAVGLLVALIGVVDSRATSAQDQIETLLPPRALAATVAPATEAQPFEARPPARPAPLVGLYVSLAGLQALDITSTRRALDAGASEANPFMAPFAASALALTVLKAGVTGATIFASERLWKKNRKAALLTMIGLNAAYGAIVARNYRIAAVQKR
jgi:hypothetical protein